MKRNAALLIVGGAIYCLLEILWRGHTHPAMFLVGGVCFVFIGGINELYPWGMPLILQMILAAIIITVLEFLSGCVFNIWLGWNIWDYSNLPGNLLGQICPQFAALWCLLSFPAIWLDDYLRYSWYDEAMPKYSLVKWNTNG